MTQDELDGRYLIDGIYEVPEDVLFVVLDTDRLKVDDPQLQIFSERHPDFVVANAYETSTTILLSQKPNKLEMKGKWFGSGFNYGSTNLLVDCPKRVLILAEND